MLVDKFEKYRNTAQHHGQTAPAFTAKKELLSLAIILGGYHISQDPNKLSRIIATVPNKKLCFFVDMHNDITIPSLAEKYFKLTLCAKKEKQASMLVGIKYSAFEQHKYKEEELRKEIDAFEAKLNSTAIELSKSIYENAQFNKLLMDASSATESDIVEFPVKNITIDMIKNNPKNKR